MAESRESAHPHPEVIRKERYPTWPEDQPFPLTPIEAWYVLQGWAVKPAAGLTRDQLLALPGKIEGHFGDDSWVWLWQA